MVAVGDCYYHGETVAEAPVWGQGGRVRVASRAGGGVAGFMGTRSRFGSGIVAGSAHFSYTSNLFFANGHPPLLLLDAPPLAIAADHATNE